LQFHAPVAGAIPRMTATTSAVLLPEPLTDFSKEAARQSMRSALETVAGQLGSTFPLVIDNKPVATAGFIESLNPSHKRQVVGRCGKASQEQAREALAAAVRAFPGWRDTPVERRAQYLLDAAAVLRRRRFELAAWGGYGCAKGRRGAAADLGEAIDFCEFYAHDMLRLAVPRERNVAGEDNVYFYEPRGPAVVIAPWNFPLAILTGMTTAALVAGNTVVMKPAEQSSVIAAKLME